MNNDAFVLLLAIGFAWLFVWAFKTLPQEDWQILAALPKEKAPDGDWRGQNLTYYGALTASATVLSATIFLVLLGAVGVSIVGSAILVTGLLAVAAPAAKIVARVVERKRATFTVGGAAFFGLLAAPALVGVINAQLGRALGTPVPLAEALAAMIVAYALGEGLGRLACISFGCCYGRPLAQSHALWRLVFGRRHFAFTGQNKKAVYEAGLDGEPVIPIQAITAVVCVGAGLGGVWLFLRAAYLPAFVAVALVTQLWRAFSETLRADYRGGGRVSAYQVMALIGALYAVVVAWVVPVSTTPSPNVVRGLSLLWGPGVILLLQALWLAMFLYTGRSVVTAATISIHVVKDRI